MHYLKRKNSQDIADRCGVGDLFRTVGDRIHMDDLRDVKAYLDMTNSGIDLLFELEDTETTTVQEVCDLFDLGYGAEEEWDGGND